MILRTSTEVAATLRQLAGGSAAADPLRAGDAAELERIAATLDEQGRRLTPGNAILQRVALSAYSLGARHALERMDAFLTDQQYLGDDDEEVCLGDDVLPPPHTADCSTAAGRPLPCAHDCPPSPSVTAPSDCPE